MNGCLRKNGLTAAFSKRQLKLSEEQANQYTDQIINALDQAIANRDAEISQKVESAPRKSIEINGTTFYVNVKENVDFFDALLDKSLDDATRTKEENHKMMQQYRNFINEKFKNKTIAVEADRFITANQKGLSHYTDASRNQYSASTAEAKMRASAELDNLISTSYLINYSTYDEVKKNHNDCVNGISNYITFFKVGNQFYKGIVTVLNLKDRRAFYDITKIKPIANRNLEQHIAPLSKQDKALQEKMLSHYLEYDNSYLNNISKKSVNNAQGPKSIKVDSEERNLSEAQQEYVAETKVVDENGKLKVVCHGCIL